MKSILDATNEHLNDLFSIGEGWELFRVIKQSGIIDIKFRKTLRSE